MSDADPHAPLPARLAPGEEIVVGEVQELLPPQPARLPAAALAAASFAAGATFAVVAQVLARRAGAGAERALAPPKGLAITRSRRFLVDVHYLGE